SGAASGRRMPASSIAIWAAATAYWMKMSIFFRSLRSMKRSASKSGTSPATRAGSAEASKRVMERMPYPLASSASQLLSTPVPSGVTSPSAVTTTRRRVPFVAPKAAMLASVRGESRQRRESPDSRRPERDVRDRGRRGDRPRDGVRGPRPRAHVGGPRTPGVEAPQLERHRHPVRPAECADQHRHEDGHEATEASHEPAPVELEAPAALRLHHGERGVVEDRNQPEGEGQGEADVVRHPQTPDRVGDLLDAGRAQEEEARGEERVEADGGREAVEEPGTGRGES